MAWLNLASMLTVVLIFLFFSRATTAISTEEVDGVLMLLRAQGHMLFANAISTSDMLFDMLSVHSLTLLAPADPTVFALDMTNTPPFYISTLRLHALPVRLSWSQIRLLSNGSLLPTLSPSRQLRVLQHRQGLNTLVVDGGEGGGVEVVMPGLYYSRDVAVHALGGILTFRSKIPITNNITTNNDNNNKTTLLFPRVDNNNTSNHTLFLPPRIPIFNSTFNRTTLLPRCPSVNHTRPVHSLAYPPSPSPAPERENMGEVLASGEMCVVG